MFRLNIHPHIGFLNTNFQISVHSSCQSSIYIYQIKNGDEAVLISTIEVQEGRGEHKYVFPKPGVFKVCSNISEENVYVEIKDAIKLGGSSYKASYISDKCPWCFVVMLDRTYFYNQYTKEEYVEYISPDSIKYLNEDKVLLLNSSEYSVFSLSEQKPIFHFSSYEFINENLIVRKECSEKNKKLVITHIGKKNLIHTELEYSCCSIDSEKQILYYAHGINCYIYDLKQFCQIKQIKLKDTPFLFSNHVLALFKTSYDNVIEIHDIEKDFFVGELRSQYPIKNIEDYSMPYYKEQQHDIFDLIKQVDSKYLLRKQSITIESFVSEIEKLFYINGKVLFIDNTRKEEYKGGKFYTRGDRYLKKIDGEKILAICNYKYECLPLNDLLIIKDEDKYYEIKDAKITYKRLGDIHLRHEGAVIVTRDQLGFETIEIRNHKHSKILGKHKYKWHLFDIYGVLVLEDENAIFSILNSEFFISITGLENLNSKLESNHYSSSNKIKELKYGNQYLFYNDQEVLLFSGFMVPDNVISCSESINKFITKRGSHFYIENRKSHNKSTYTTEILTTLFDSSSYRNVLMSDNGENLLYQEGATMFLLNPFTMEKQEFPNLNFIGHKNGYKPLFKFDYYRRPVLIDPLTKREIDHNHISEYTFESPDQELYAFTNVGKKYYNKITDRYISYTEYDNLKRKFGHTGQYSTNNKQIEARKEFISNHKDFEELNDNCLYAYDFVGIFINEEQHILIKQTKDDVIVSDINIGTPLSFLNYVAFSYDSRYVGIVGKMGWNTSLLLIYDLVGRFVLFKGNYSKAMWKIAFSKDNTFAAYDSNPTSYYGKIKQLYDCKLPITEKNDEEVLQTIPGRSFLSFSPDGSLLALSDKRYIPYEYRTDNHCWGHLPTTNIYIHSTGDPKKQIVPTISDLSYCTYEGGQTLHSCSFSLNNDKLMMTGADETVVIRNLHIETMLSK